MFSIRNYTDADGVETGILITDTYRRFNLDFVPTEEMEAFLGPFYHARSVDPAHRQAVLEILRSPMMYVAVSDGRIVGVLRGREERLASLFVHSDFHHQGIASSLVERFEADSLEMDVKLIRVSATLYAVPFYSKMGYKKSTGERLSWSFGGHGLPVQPMKKILIPPQTNRT